MYATLDMTCIGEQRIVYILAKIRQLPHLSWQDHHEDFLLIATQHMLHKGPSRADQDYCEEQKTTLEYLFFRFSTD